MKKTYLSVALVAALASSNLFAGELNLGGSIGTPSENTTPQLMDVRLSGFRITQDDDEAIVSVDVTSTGLSEDVNFVFTAANGQVVENYVHLGSKPGSSRMYGRFNFVVPTAEVVGTSHVIIYPEVDDNPNNNSLSYEIELPDEPINDARHLSTMIYNFYDMPEPGTTEQPYVDDTVLIEVKYEKVSGEGFHANHDSDVRITANGMSHISSCVWMENQSGGLFCIAAFETTYPSIGDSLYYRTYIESQLLDPIDENSSNDSASIRKTIHEETCVGSWTLNAIDGSHHKTLAGRAKGGRLYVGNNTPIDWYTTESSLDGTMFTVSWHDPVYIDNLGLCPTTAIAVNNLNHSEWFHYSVDIN